MQKLAFSRTLSARAGLVGPGLTPGCPPVALEALAGAGRPRDSRFGPPPLVVGRVGA